MKKKTPNSLIAAILTLTLVITSIAFAPVSYAVTDTKGPEVDLDSITLSTQKITDRYKSPTIKLKATDESGVFSITVFWDLGESVNSSPASADLEYNDNTGFWEGKIEYTGYDSVADARIGYYGMYELDQITAVDYYSNEVVLDDLTVPNGNFEVVGGIPEDKTVPAVDFENIVLDKVVATGDTAVITIPIKDDSEIISGNISYFSQRGGTAGCVLTEKSDGIYQGKLNFEENGEYQLNMIMLTDANNNYIEIRNCDCFLNDWADDGYSESYMQYKALGFLNIQYGDPIPTDFTASIELMELSNLMVKRKSGVSDEMLTVTFESSTPLKSMEVEYKYENAEYGTLSYASKVRDNTFEIYLPAYFYGKWELSSVVAIDIYGNRKPFYDPDRGAYTDIFESTEMIEVDFDSGDYDYYVGIIDSDSGLGVSDSKFDDTTELLVDEESLNSELCEEMVEEDSIGVALYDVEVDGSRDKETAVSFLAPEGFVDSDKVEVVHKRHDGTNEIFEAEVKHDRITIKTDEFSPFLVQIDKEHEHRFKVNEAVSATCTKDGNLRYYSCDLCKAYFLDAEGKDEIDAADVVIKAPGKHNLVTDKAVAATTARDGKTAGKHCSVCGKVTVVQKKIPRISKVSLSYTKKNYTGSSIKAPVLTITDSSGKKLVKGTDYTVTGLTGETKVGRYKVAVTFKGKYSGSKNLYFTIVPKAPATAKAQLSTASGGYNDIKFSWSKAAGATGYTVYYKKSTAKNYTYLTRTTGTSITKKNLKDGSRYYFKVVPYYKSGETRYTSLSYKTANCYALKKMAKPKVTKNGTNVKISWTNINGETGYQISKSTKEKGTNIVCTYKTTTGKYKVISAKKGVKYYYKVRAYKSVKVGEKYVKVYGPWSGTYKLKR